MLIIKNGYNVLRREVKIFHLQTVVVHYAYLLHSLLQSVLL